MTLATEVMDVIDAVIVLKKPLPEDVSKALQTPLPLIEAKAAYDKYGATFPKGPFSTADLSFRKELGFGMLVLNSRSGQTLEQKDLDLLRFGPLPGPEINPQTPPEGTISYRFPFQEGALQLTFQFTKVTKKLSFVSL